MRRTDCEPGLIVLWERAEASDPQVSPRLSRPRIDRDPFWRPRDSRSDRGGAGRPAADWPEGPLSDPRYLDPDSEARQEPVTALQRARQRWWSRPTLIHALTALTTSGLLALGLLAGSGVAVEAQVTPETPRLLGAEVPRGFGLYYLDFGALPGDGRGVMATWTGGLPEGFRLRGGWAEGAGGENAGFGGIDLWRSISDRSDNLPVDLLWTTGAGASVGEYTLVSVPLGLTAGRGWSSGSVWVSPWLHAGVVFDLRLGDEAPDGEFEVGVATDIGVHVALDRARRVVVSASAGLGDRQAVAIGVVVGR